MEDLLFSDQREHPAFYRVRVRSKWERTVSIRGGISWPGVSSPGYFVLLAQLEETTVKEKKPTLLAFEEHQSPLLSDFFKRIVKTCGNYRIDYLCHGAEPSEEGFSNQLTDYLWSKRDGAGGEVVQRPPVWKSYRSAEINFLSQLLKSYIATKEPILFNVDESRAPKLIDKIKNISPETNILEVPEIKALCYVLDDFDISPWKPPREPGRRPSESNWAV